MLRYTSLILGLLLATNNSLLASGPKALTKSVAMNKANGRPIVCIQANSDTYTHVKFNGINKKFIKLHPSLEPVFTNSNSHCAIIDNEGNRFGISHKVCRNNECQSYTSSFDIVAYPGNDDNVYTVHLYDGKFSSPSAGLIKTTDLSTYYGTPSANDSHNSHNTNNTNNTNNTTGHNEGVPSMYEANDVDEEDDNGVLEDNFVLPGDVVDMLEKNGLSPDDVTPDDIKQLSPDDYTVLLKYNLIPQEYIDDNHHELPEDMPEYMTNNPLVQ